MRTRLALVVLAALVLLAAVTTLSATAPRRLWQTEKAAGFGFLLPGQAPDGLTLRGARLLNSTTGTPALEALVRYAEKRQSLMLFESPYPISVGGLIAHHGPSIIEERGGPSPVWRGDVRVLGLYVEAFGVGMTEPQFAETLAHLVPADGGLDNILFNHTSW